MFVELSKWIEINSANQAFVITPQTVRRSYEISFCCWIYIYFNRYFARLKKFTRRKNIAKNKNERRPRKVSRRSLNFWIYQRDKKLNKEIRTKGGAVIGQLLIPALQVFQ